MEDSVPNKTEIKQEIIRDEAGRILPGSGPLNPVGRPKGKTLKEFAREYLMDLPDDEKKAYLATLPKEIVWKMAEGNPHNTEDVTSGNKVLQPILVKFLNGDKQND